MLRGSLVSNPSPYPSLYPYPRFAGRGDGFKRFHSNLSKSGMRPGVLQLIQISFKIALLDEAAGCNIGRFPEASCPRKWAKPNRFFTIGNLTFWPNIGGRMGAMRRKGYGYSFTWAAGKAPS